MSLLPKRRQIPHRSWDPRRAYGADRLAEALRQHRAGNADAAAEIYMQLEAERSPHYHARMMGALLHYERTSDPTEAIPLLKGVGEALPKWPDVWYNLGVIHENIGQYEQARHYFQKCLAIEPAHAPAWVNLGNVNLGLGLVDEADTCFSAAQLIEPDGPLGLYNLMHVRGLQNKWEETYEYHEYRWLTPGHLRSHGLPRKVRPWEPPEHVGTLIVSDEQGAGDVIQFSRFLPRLHDYCDRLICTIRHPSLIPLLAYNFPFVEFVEHQNDSAPEADAHVPLLSLVHRLGLSEWDVAERTPKGDAAAFMVPRIVMPYKPNSVGVCWAGSKDHKRDAVRSIPFEQFAPLLDVKGVTFYNLTLNDRGVVPDDRLVSMHGQFKDFLDSASFFQTLDAIVTVDTSTLHLGGALGVPVLGLIAATPDFRWGLNRSDTPWYHSVELCRQEKIGDWSSAIERAKQWIQARVMQ